MGTTNALRSMESILDAASHIDDRGALLHLRSAFIRLSNVVVDREFPTLTPKKSPTFQCNGKEYCATTDGVTISYDEFESIIADKKLDAVKKYKNRTGASLLVSKHAIEQWANCYGLLRPKQY